MTAAISLPGLLTALLLPWLLGSAWVYYLLRQSGRWNRFVVAGHGYIAGVFLTTLALRAYAALGLPLHYWTLVAILAALALLPVALVRKAALPRQLDASGYNYRLWQKAVITLMLSLLLVRYTTLAQELALRPLFAWDSWMNWYPKAAVWYHFNDLVPYVSPEQWLAQAAGDNSYTLGNQRAWRYPPTVPLIQLWSMLGAGSASHPLLYLPWLLAVLAVGMALYGHMRLTGSTATVAVGAAYCLLSLPYFNVHTALVGYADLWLAGAFGLAGFALYEWQTTRHVAYAVLAVFMALLCTQLKVPGLIFGAIVLTVFAASLVPARRHLLTSLGGLAVLLAVLAIIGLDVDLPGIGAVKLSLNHVELPYLGSFNLKYHSLKGSLAEALLKSLNWNLLWYLVIAFALASVCARRPSPRPSLDTWCALLALPFLLFVFHFTYHYAFAINFTTVNRAFMYPVPILVFVLFRSLATARANPPDAK
ncbi:MAG: hypothetical protein R3228_02540 [Halioglobus sp.]|nr:hypothetical protein [Halioglobus sp.]